MLLFVWIEVLRGGGNFAQDNQPLGVCNPVFPVPGIVLGAKNSTRSTKEAMANEIKYLPDTPVPLHKVLEEDTREDCLPCRAIGMALAFFYSFLPPPRFQPF